MDRTTTKDTAIMVKFSNQLSMVAAGIVLAVFGAATSVHAASAPVGTAGNCNDVKAAQQAISQQVAQNSMDQINNNVAQPSALSGCLSSLNGLNVSIGDFNFSSIYNSLISQACGMVNNEVQSQFGSAVSGANQYINDKTGGVAGQVVNVNQGSQAITSQPVMTTINNGNLNY